MIGRVCECTPHCTMYLQAGRKGAQNQLFSHGLPSQMTANNSLSRDDVRQALLDPVMALYLDKVTACRISSRISSDALLCVCTGSKKHACLEKEANVRALKKKQTCCVQVDKYIYSSAFKGWAQQQQQQKDMGILTTCGGSKLTANLVVLLQVYNEHNQCK